MRVVFRNYPFLGPESTAAAEAAQCAAEQNRFWPYHDILFERQGAENRGTFSPENLKQFARDVPGLNTEQFDQCVDTGKYKQKIADEKAAATRQGVNATPTVYVGDEQLPGVPSRDTLFKAIEERLKK